MYTPTWGSFGFAMSVHVYPPQVCPQPSLLVIKNWLTIKTINEIHDAQICIIMSLALWEQEMIRTHLNIFILYMYIRYAFPGSSSI